MKRTGLGVMTLLITGCGSGPAVYTVESPEGSYVAHYKGDGGAVIGALDAKTRIHRICVAPAAQSALTLSSKTSASGDATVKGAGEFGVKLDQESAEAITKMFEHTERSLFLQYALYRLCEASANDMFGDAKVTTADDCKPLQNLTVSSQAYLEAAIAKHEVSVEKVTAAQKDDERARALENAALTGAWLESSRTLAQGDRKAYQDCVKQIGGSTYERKFSHVIQAAVELYRLEAGTEKKGGVPEKDPAPEKPQATASPAPSPSESAKAKAPEAPATKPGTAR